MVGMFKWQAYKCVAPRVAPTCYIGTAYLRKLRGVSKPLICTSMWKHTPGEWSSDEISRIRNDSVVATLLCVKKKKKLRDEWNGNFSPEFHRNFHGNEDQRFSMNDCNKCKNVEEWKSDFRRLEILEKSGIFNFFWEINYYYIKNSNTMILLRIRFQKKIMIVGILQTHAYNSKI